MSVIVEPGRTFLDNSGRVLSSGTVTFYVAGQTVTKISIFATAAHQAAGTPAISNPQTLSSAGRLTTQVHAAGPCRMIVKDSLGAIILDEDNVVTTDYSALTRSVVGGIFYPRTDDEIAAGITPTNYYYGIEPYDPRRYGADITGATNTTTALFNFYKVCYQSGAWGHIPAGTYKLTTGVLHFNNNFTDKAWPRITTDGHKSVIFNIDSSTETNEPLLKWSNGTANSPVGKYWRGGCHGGVTVNGSQTGSARTSQHHFSFTGMWAIELGWMVSNYCKGDSFHIPQNLYGGTNPDPYAASYIHAQGLESNYATGYAFRNLNWVGMDGWRVEAIRIIEPASGGWWGIGSGCTLKNWSCANVQNGYAFDDGCFTANTGGTPQRNLIQIAEFDNCQYGIRLNVINRTRIEDIRFVHRYQTTPNVSAVYWPVTAINLAGGTSPALTDIYIDTFERYESGGAIGTIGTWLDGNNIASAEVDINVNYADNGALGLTDANFIGTNINASSSTRILRRGVPLRDLYIRQALLVRASTSSTIAHHATPTIASTNVMTFATELSDRNSIYDNSTYKATVPYSGLYHVFGRICFPSAVGTKVVLGFFANTTCVLARTDYSQNVGDQTYELSGIVSLVAGELVGFCGVQNSGGAINFTNPVGATADLVWSMTPIG